MSESLSARRAWIEIKNAMEINGSHGVALRKESVDRNIYVGVHKRIAVVALRKESVDRNARICSPADGCERRSPQGERG